MRALGEFLKATVPPAVYVADSETQPEGRCVSGNLEQTAGKRGPEPTKNFTKGLILIFLKLP